MKFHEIIPELLNGKKFISGDWVHEPRHIYAVHHSDGSFHLMWSDDVRVTTVTIGAWLAGNNDGWEEYKDYPRDLSFAEACHLAYEMGAIISTDGLGNYNWHDGMLRGYGFGKPLEPNLFIFQKWYVVGYKENDDEIYY